MLDRTPDQTTIVDELKELGRQLTATLKAVAGSPQVRSLGHELRDGLREAAQNVEEAWAGIRERDEVQRLQARAADVADALKSGDARDEIRGELGDALRALNVRLGQLLERLTTPAADTPPVVPPLDSPTSLADDEAYTGATRALKP